MNKFILLLVGGVIGAVAVFFFTRVDFGGGSDLSFLGQSSKVKIETSKTRALGLPDAKEIQKFKDDCHTHGGIVATTEEADGSTYLLCIKAGGRRAKIIDALDLNRSY